MERGASKVINASRDAVVGIFTERGALRCAALRRCYARLQASAFSWALGSFPERGGCTAGAAMFEYLALTVDSRV